MKADSIIYGHIVTLDTDLPEAEAIAVKDGIIVYAGRLTAGRPAIIKKHLYQFASSDRF